jgi:hypothetical protein
MKLIDYKNASGLTYFQIGDLTGVDGARACNRIRRPEISPAEWIIKVAPVIGMPLIEAIEEWKSARNGKK